jgi:hypothetical protein
MNNTVDTTDGTMEVGPEVSDLPVEVAESSEELEAVSVDTKEAIDESLDRGEYLKDLNDRLWAEVKPFNKILDRALEVAKDPYKHSLKDILALEKEIYMFGDLIDLLYTRKSSHTMYATEFMKYQDYLHWKTRVLRFKIEGEFLDKFRDFKGFFNRAVIERFASAIHRRTGESYYPGVETGFVDGRMSGGRLGGCKLFRYQRHKSYGSSDFGPNKGVYLGDLLKDAFPELDVPAWKNPEWDDSEWS